MKKKYRIKYQKNNNEFSSLFGIDAFQMKGGSNCLITKGMVTRDLQHEAYCAYQNIPINTSIKVSPSCGVENCVKKDHLVATYKPSQKDAKYIKDNIKMNGIEWIANAFNVPMTLLEDYLTPKTSQNQPPPVSPVPHSPH